MHLDRTLDHFFDDHIIAQPSVEAAFLDLSQIGPALSLQHFEPKSFRESDQRKRCFPSLEIRKHIRVTIQLTQSFLSTDKKSKTTATDKLIAHVSRLNKVLTLRW